METDKASCLEPRLPACCEEINHGYYVVDEVQK